MEEQEVRCLQHCDRDRNIVCFTVPLVCPLCGGDMTRTPLRIPPYLISSPFTDAQHNPCSLVIKPTIGHFLHDFSINSNLHIGLTDSRGQVHEFDERGVTVGGKDWAHCLTLSVTTNVEFGDSMRRWDHGLQQFSNERLWRQEYYDDDKHNCYDFVLRFLHWVGVDRLYPCLVDKSLFCEQMILPATCRAGKYISLYREIDKCGVVIQNVHIEQGSTSVCTGR